LEGPAAGIRLGNNSATTRNNVHRETETLWPRLSKAARQELKQA